MSSSSASASASSSTKNSAGLSSWEHGEHRDFSHIPDLEDVKPGDVVGTLHGRANRIREHWVRHMQMRLLGKQLQECFLTEGVNYIQNCRELSLRYIEAIDNHLVKGWMHKPDDKAI